MRESVRLFGCPLLSCLLEALDDHHRASMQESRHIHVPLSRHLKQLAFRVDARRHSRL